MIRILVVDDEPQLRSLMERALERMHYAVTGVGTIREAMHQDGPWDLLLLDRRLPNGDGKRVAEHFQGTPTLYISGFADADLQKPFTMKELQTTVAERIGT